jgi:DNA modification methylase
LKELPTESVHCCVTSPPYYALRDYGVDGQIGREATPKDYIMRLTEVFTEVRRILRPDGTLWLNISDTYAGKGNQGEYVDAKNPHGRNGQAVALNYKVEGCKPKDMIGIPWMLAFALRDAGWYLRNDIIWMKENPMPESVKDRCARCYEHIFLFSKSRKYHFDYKAISEPIAPATAQRLKRGISERNKYGIAIPGQAQQQTINRPREHGEITEDKINPLRNKRDVWIINTVPFKGGHYAAYPPKLVETCLLAGCPEGGIVLDPFMGSGTTGMVAKQLNRHYIGVELNPEYADLALARIGGEI